ncbi:MAG: choice-of-anchor L domain-containing protein [Lewinellaceae bacterium]|nr:choice-of-anchor L domain-containing protein [Lewinellaceae bacterium]
MRLNYCFASEEFPMYSCQQYNDMFGIFMEGRV